MHSLPEPTLSFTIPSLHDGKFLACRIYLPKRVAQIQSTKKGAILAHPYAPLGGSFDDPVVSIVGSEILNHDRILMTFNFRGAGDSEGRTSWTAKPECSDYASVAGFFIQYLSRLDFEPKISKKPSFNGSFGPVDVIMAGYSYGSMIATRCPALPSILAPFGSYLPGTFPAEVSLRAAHLASETNEEYRQARSTTIPNSRQSIDHTLLVGGDEGSPRKSKEHRRSIDMRKSLDVMSRQMHLHKHSLRSKHKDKPKSTAIPEVSQDFDFQIKLSYLLISPLLPPISTFTALSFPFHNDHDIHTKKLTTSPTLAIFGSKDVFTASKKLKLWGEGLQNVNRTFEWTEVDGAGHFWRESGTEEVLIDRIGKWIASLDMTKSTALF
ncbi:hypothetical protein BT63DRAFT_459536 [Microthyrium microscopicum]|uniref:AB hydrolase-1 domain-containing protein n=1 Tax=Microthyrium microscopicum TaxID=703497 RepID=A0A6A6U1C1_9PEZI|nr:hypothetical protein BT63DRAFT_459536 [Microthyrium microscopicum]